MQHEFTTLPLQPWYLITSSHCAQFVGSKVEDRTLIIYIRLNDNDYPGAILVLSLCISRWLAIILIHVISALGGRWYVYQCIRINSHECTLGMIRLIWHESWGTRNMKSSECLVARLWIDPWPTTSFRSTLALSCCSTCLARVPINTYCKLQKMSSYR